MSANLSTATANHLPNPSDIRTGDGNPGLARFAWGVLGWNILVIIWGAYVRASKSGDGCGSHWPLCNGEVVPGGASVSTMVEFTHRLTSGLALIGVLAMLVWGFRAFAKGHVVRKAVFFTFVFIIIEALIGALLVKFELVAENKSVARAIYLSVHLVNTFLLLGALSLSVWWASGRPSITFRGQDGTKTFLIFLGLVATIAVGVTGAIAALGDTLFPAQSLAHGFEQELSGLSHFTVRLRWLHPVVAIAASLVVAAVAWRAKSLGSPISRLLGWLVVGTVVLQLALGTLNVWLLAPIWMQLVHLLFADALWVLMVLLSASLLSRTKSVYQGAIA